MQPRKGQVPERDAFIIETALQLFQLMYSPSAVYFTNMNLQTYFRNTSDCYRLFAFVSLLFANYIGCPNTPNRLELMNVTQIGFSEISVIYQNYFNRTTIHLQEYLLTSKMAASTI